MFKKLKDKLEEEFKQGPLKLPVSVQQLAQVISPSPSLNSLSDNNPSSSVTYTSDPSNVSTDFFSIGDDDDSQDGSSKTLPLHSIDLTATSPSNMTQNRSRRSSLSSVASEASSLFPIFENPSGSNYFQSDLESEMEDGMPSQLEKISKEQLYQSYKKIFNRYNKYKGRYVDLHKHYKELLHDNIKTKNVLQESQDKALRRIAELKEQCQLEQNAKAHLEESLRNDVEDRDHMIATLKTKISLLRGGGGNDGLLVGVNDKDDTNVTKNQSDEVEKLKKENESLQKEISDLKKLKDTACHLIHRCDTTINEATEDVSNENLKRKMSELKGEIQKMKSENESLSHLLSRNIITDEDKRVQGNSDGNLLIDLSCVDSSQGYQRFDEKDKKIEKLNNLLLKCKEKISSLTVEMKSKNLIIEDKNKKLKEVGEELETNKKSVARLSAEVQALKVREEENVLSVAENKMAIHKELETKEEQIRALTKELKTSENEYRKEKDEIIKKYEDKLRKMTENFTRELKYKNEENEKLSEDLNYSKMETLSVMKNGESPEKTKYWEAEFKKMLDNIVSERSYESFLESKSAEIEKASFKLEERLSSLQINLTDLIQTKQRELENAHRKLNEIIEEKDRKIGEMEKSVAAEREGSLEKLSLEVKNLTRKIEELESALSESKLRNDELASEKEFLSQEGDKLKREIKNFEIFKVRLADLESECESMKKENAEVAAEKKRLSEELSHQMEKLQTAEGRNNLLEKINTEKAEAEKRLREYIENYNKLEKENQVLESDLSQKCDKLVKDLNESKEKIKVLEGENKAKTSEAEGLKEELMKVKAELEEMVRSQALQSEARETSAAKDEASVQWEKASAELSSLQKEHSEVIREKSVIEEENFRLKNELLSAHGRVKDADEGVRIIQELNKRVNELEAEKGELSSEVRKLSEKLESESRTIEQLKKVSEEKKKLEDEVTSLKGRNLELEESLLIMEREYEGEKASTSEKGENESLRKELSAVREAGREKTEENEKMKLELAESEKSRSEIAEKLKEAIREKNEVSDTLQMKLNELEAVKKSLDSTREELTARVKTLEEEKQTLTSESENKLNVLKNEIKFMNNKFEEDIGNMEENRSVEMSELSTKLEVAEKASDELLQKLERITTERDEARTAMEERDMKIAEMESCLASLKVDMDSSFSEGQPIEGSEKHEQEMRNTVTRYESELMKREKEVQKLQKQLEEYSQLIQNFKSTNESSRTEEIPEGKKDSEREEEEVMEKECRQLSSAEPDGFHLESETMESIRKKLIQQSAELKELRKQHKREVTELRKIISVRRKGRRNSAEGPDWGGTLDNDTEHEYLRNILYEYMMGREQLVLAKVLSAIVKFDKQQTRNVLEKEQHRQTLLGQLGIL